LLGAIGFGLIAVTWLATGLPRSREQARALVAAEKERVRSAGQRLAESIGRSLDELVERENQRPYYQYQNLYSDPRTAAQGPAVAPSPLAQGEISPLIRTHFHIDERGKLTIPSVNEDLPELSNPRGLAERKRLLALLRKSEGALRRNVETRQRVQQVEQQAYVQNRAPNQVYQQLQTQRAPFAQQKKGKVAIQTRDFAWQRVELDGTSELAALRTVATPAGEITQGFVVDSGELERVLEQRKPAELKARWMDGSADPDLVRFDLPGVPELALGIDLEQRMAAVRAEADDIRRGFWLVYLPAMLVGLASVLGMAWLVSRSEKLARERSHFAAAAAHELRTPLASLQLYGDMLADGLGDPDKAELYARRIAEEAGRLGRVVSNVLNFSRLERGGLTLSASKGDATAAVREAVERARPSLQRSGMVVDFEPGQPQPAVYDSDALARILDNLIDNAEKYTREQDQRELHLRVERDADRVAITVADNGPGLPDSLRGDPFTLFRRGATEDQPAGLGLGLSLSRQLARALGGDLVCLDSARGARFAVYLPTA
jgi:signal transduction histidine kinase